MHKSVFLTAQWRHLAMINYEVDPDVLAPLAPAGTELDFHEGRTFVSLVGFLFEDVRLRGAGIPWHRNFAEVNLRFYVRRDLPDEIRRGVVFIKEICPLPAVTAVARWCYGENYFTHAMRHAVEDHPQRASAEFAIWTAGSWQRFRVAGQGRLHAPERESEEHFIIDHYWGYTRRSSTRTSEYQVAHSPWKVRPACHAEIDCDFAALYDQPFAEALSRRPSSVLLADGSAVSVHCGEELVIVDRAEVRARALQGARNEVTE
jgi:uncharacterized protein YqjF (DUF2071 family)